MVLGHEDVIHLLLEIPAVPVKDLSPLAAVRQRRLLSAVTPLHWAADGGHSACVELLLGIDVWREAADRPTPDRRTVGEFTAAAGTTPLMLAARAGSAGILRQIIHVVGDVLVVDRQDEDGL